MIPGKASLIDSGFLSKQAEPPLCFGDQLLSSSVPVWARDAYFGALTLYAMLLGFTGVGFSYDVKGHEMPSFLFSLDGIFESYVRNTFKFILREQSVLVLDGNLSRYQCPLFLDNRRFPTKPDLIFRKGMDVLGIGEVKYKPRIGEEDRYQLISHVVAHGAPVGVWISPAIDGYVGLEYIGSISTGARFYHYRLNIADDLDTARLDMVNKVASLLV